MGSKSHVSICVELTLVLYMVAAALSAEWQRRLATGRRKHGHGREPALCSKDSLNRGIGWQRCKTRARSTTGCVTKLRAETLCGFVKRVGQCKIPSGIGRASLKGFYLHPLDPYDQG